MDASSYETRLAADIHRTTLEERADVLDFRARMYGVRSAFADPAWVRWLYDEVPTRRARPALWVFRRAGTIHGQIGAILTRVRAGDVERDLAWALDLMISPEQRMRGAGAVLPKAARDASDMLGGTEVSEAARKAFARAGWQDHGSLPRWVRPVRGAFVRARSDVPLARLLGRGLGAGARALSAIRVARSRGRRLVSIAAFDDRADRVWQNAGARWPVIVRRDRAWLAWRWDACPDRRGARAFYMERRGEVLGWVVLRTGEERGLRAGYIVDLLCAPEELQWLLALSVDALSKMDVDAVYCLFRAPGVEPALAANGFFRRESGFAMMTYSAPTVEDETRALLGDPSQWFVTSGDSDLDRRRDGTVYA